MLTFYNYDINKIVLNKKYYNMYIWWATKI